MKRSEIMIIFFLAGVTLILTATTKVYADVATPPASVVGLSVLIIAAVIIVVGFFIPYLLRKIRNKK